MGQRSGLMSAQGAAWKTGTNKMQKPQRGGPKPEKPRVAAPFWLAFIHHLRHPGRRCARPGLTQGRVFGPKGFSEKLLVQWWNPLKYSVLYVET